MIIHIHNRMCVCVCVSVCVCVCVHTLRLSELSHKAKLGVKCENMDTLRPINVINHS